MRVLHVIDAGSPRTREFARPRPSEGFDDRALACGLILRGLPHEGHVCLIGTHQAAARARSLGVAVGSRINPFLGGLRGAARGMGNLISAIRPDLVHWWGPGLAAGCFGRPGKAWRGEMWTGATPLSLPVWLSGGTAIACGPEEERFAMRAGFHKVASMESPVFVAGGSRDPQDRARLMALGPGSDARAFWFLLGILSTAGHPVHGVLSVEARQRARARRCITPSWDDFSHSTSDRPRSELLSSADLAVWMGGGTQASPAIPIRSALARGIPVVAPPAAAHLFPESIVGDCIGLNATPAELARKLVRMVADPSLRARVGGLARAGLNPAVLNLRFQDAVAAAWSGHVGSSWMPEVREKEAAVAESAA